MDADNLEVDISQFSQLEIKEDKVAEINTLEQNEEPNTTRRSARKIINHSESEKRRVRSKPKRLPENHNFKSIINYYLDKKIKKNPTHLETIFEEPDPNNIIMSRRKYSRSMQFPSEMSLAKNKNKVKKRCLKAKLKGSSKRKKLNMDLLLQKLSGIECEDC